MPTDGQIKHHNLHTGYAPHIWKPWSDNKPILRVITTVLPGDAVDWFICNHNETGEITALARDRKSACILAGLLRMTADKLEKEADNEPNSDTTE